MKKNKLWHTLFLIGIFFKGLDGILELAGGVIFLFLKHGTLLRYMGILFQHELAEDPRDLVAGFLVRHTEHLGVATVHFAAAYLLVHGIIKVGLAIGLLRGRRGVFPLALAFLGLFLVYQGYRMLLMPSAALAVLIVVDAAILALIWKEYTATRPAG